MKKKMWMYDRYVNKQRKTKHVESNDKFNFEFPLKFEDKSRQTSEQLAF